MFILLGLHTVCGLGYAQTHQHFTAKHSLLKMVYDTEIKSVKILKLNIGYLLC